MPRRTLLMVAVLAAALLTYWAMDAMQQSQPPVLQSVYDDLERYVDEWVTFTGAAPHEILISEWFLEYDAEGAIVYHRLVLHVERVDAYETYVLSQRAGGRVNLSRREQRDFTPVAVLAQPFFSSLNRVGLQQLEQHLGLTPPTTLRLVTQRTAAALGFHPDAGARVLQDGSIAAAPANFTVHGSYGLLYFSDDRAPKHMFIVQ